jgi:DNA invertase Pin-like site-specific DNA recombinase
MGENIAYVRVSSGGQVTDRQDFEGIKINQVFEEKESGGKRDRPVLNNCLGYIRKGDVLYVHSIDRLARDLRDLQDIVEKIVDKGAAVRFVKESLEFDGSNPSPIHKMIMQMLGAFAEFERAMIRERQREGIAAAKKKGIKFGRRQVIDDQVAQDLFKMLLGGMNKTDAAKQLGISRQSVYNYMKTLPAEKEKELRLAAVLNQERFEI